MGKKRRKLKRALVLLASLLSIGGALFGALLQGRDGYKLWAYSTGADSYCYIRYLFRTSDALKFSLVNEGPYPVFDATMQVIDHNKWIQLGGTVHGFTEQPPIPLLEKDLRLEADTTMNMPVGNVRPNEVRWVWDAPVPNNRLQAYYVNISARNGYVTEEILLSKNGDGIVASALRVWKPTGTIVNGWFQMRVVKEEIPGSFLQAYPSGVPWTLDPNSFTPK
jgi:hypothetical protein